MNNYKRAVGRGKIRRNMADYPFLYVVRSREFKDRDRRRQARGGFATVKEKFILPLSTVNSLYTNESCQNHDEKVRYFLLCFFHIFCILLLATCFNVILYKSTFAVL